MENNETNRNDERFVLLQTKVSRHAAEQLARIADVVIRIIQENATAKTLDNNISQQLINNLQLKTT